MKREERLIERLRRYEENGRYPFHMPGHKRLSGAEGDWRETLEFPNPFTVDITEIEGFDNLHHPEGILKESMEWAAKIYGAEKTWYLVNGSSSGILAAISAATSSGGKILVSRNCHKAVYHGIYLNRLEASYLYPQTVPKLGIQGGILPEDVEKALKDCPDIQAVLVVSPTYDGIVSNIHKISQIVHSHGLPLIVDEAHGAHFPFGEEFPASALDQGADLVIQSLHKTLPSLTQTAVIHLRKNSNYVNYKKLEYFLQIYQSSSPSYILMASIENAIYWMDRAAESRGLPGNPLDLYGSRLGQLRGNLGRLRRLSLVGEDLKGSCGIFGVDPSKIVVSTVGTSLTGPQLDRQLRERYQLEMEMCSPWGVTAITTVMDSQEGLRRLEQALLEIDGQLEAAEEPPQCKDPLAERPSICRTICQAVEASSWPVSIEDSAGYISGEFVYLYPPGIPIVAPGERITVFKRDMIHQYIVQGLAVQGLRDHALKTIDVIG